MKDIEFFEAIEKSTYMTKYEAIVSRDDLSIYAYEALSQFDTNIEINTEEIFRRLHHNNNFFFQLEKRNKSLQIDNFDLDYKLFLNFDADIVVTKEQQDYWKSLLIKNREKIVVEITENGNDDEKSATIMKNFSSWLNKNNISSALDDFAQDGSMFSFSIMDNSEYIKIDKSFIKQIRNNKNYIYYLEGFLKTCKLNNKKTIIEGIETKSDLTLIEPLDFDFIQGYYFEDLNIYKT